jgi:hypothetical protein
MQPFLLHLPDVIAQVHDRKFLSSSFRASSSFGFVYLSSSCLLLILGPPCDTSYMSFNRCPLPAMSSVPRAPRSCNKTPGGVCVRNHLQSPPYSHLDASHRSPQWVRFCSTVVSSSIPYKLVSLLFRYLSTSMFLFPEVFPCPLACLVSYSFAFLGCAHTSSLECEFSDGPSLIRGRRVWVLRALGNLHMFPDLDLATPIRQYVGEYTYYHSLDYRVSLTPSSYAQREITDLRLVGLLRPRSHQIFWQHIITIQWVS